MQDAHDAFCKIVYIVEKGMQSFYNTLLDWAHNMAVFLDKFMLQEYFLEEIPSKMLHVLIWDEKLALKVRS